MVRMSHHGIEHRPSSRLAGSNVDALRKSASIRRSLRLCDFGHASTVSADYLCYGWNLDPACTMTVCCHRLLVNVQPSVERNPSLAPLVAIAWLAATPFLIDRCKLERFYCSTHASCSAVLLYIYFPRDRPFVCQKQPSENLVRPNVSVSIHDEYIPTQHRLYPHSSAGISFSRCPNAGTQTSGARFIVHWQPDMVSSAA